MLPAASGSLPVAAARENPKIGFKSIKYLRPRPSVTEHVIIQLRSPHKRPERAPDLEIKISDIGFFLHLQLSQLKRQPAR